MSNIVSEIIKEAKTRPFTIGELVRVIRYPVFSFLSTFYNDHYMPIFLYSSRKDKRPELSSAGLQKSIPVGEVVTVIDNLKDLSSEIIILWSEKLWYINKRGLEKVNKQAII